MLDKCLYVLNMLSSVNKGIKDLDHLYFIVFILIKAPSFINAPPTFYGKKGARFHQNGFMIQLFCIVAHILSEKRHV